jgi:ElaB/YqjD/DUF883 family membrane-anchored ribosome-binding protein
MATTTRGSATTGGAAAAGRPESESIEAEVAELRAELARLTKEFAALGEKSAGTARRAASEGVEQLRARGEAKMAELRAGTSQMEDQIADTVREKPITSLAIAAGVGFLFALIARR